MEHVRVGEDQVRAAPDRRPVLARRVAVVDRVAQLAAGRSSDELARLVLGQRLGRVEVERPAPSGRAAIASSTGRLKRQRLARRGAAGDDHVAVARPPRAPRAGASRARRSRPRASAAASSGASEAGSATGSRRRAALDALGDQAAVDRARPRSQPLPARRGGARRASSRSTRLGASPRSPPRPAARRARSRSWRRRISAPPRDRERRRRGGRPLALARRQPLLPGAGQHRAEEVLARERDEQRAAERAQLAEPAQDLEVVVDREVEVEARVERDLLLGDAAPDAPPRSARANQRLQVVDGVAVGAAGSRSTRGGPSMCMST